MILGMGKNRTFSESLRRAIDNAPITRYRLCKETGIGQPTLSRFMHGKAGLTIENLDLVCEHLGLQLVESKTSKKR